MECYLPLLRVLEDSSSANNQNPKLTISLSPTLLSLLNDQDLKNRFPKWLKTRLNILKKVNKDQVDSANSLADNISIQLSDWYACEGNLIKRFSNLMEADVIDILTCAATHGYLPLLRENTECVFAQLSTAVKEHIRFFGVNPQGIWLPECAYFEGLDKLMVANGLRYSILDGHGVLHAKPRPKYGIYAPICTKNGVAFFGRDSDSTLPVWASNHGYPGDSKYREFHRDLGWDLPVEALRKIGIEEPRPLGLKLNKVTAQNIPLKDKGFYQAEKANIQVKEHAKEYLLGRKLQFNNLYKAINQEPLLVAPFDAELFGHWWFEGPRFLSELFKQSGEQNIEFTKLNDVLKESPRIQLCEPCPSSWGQGGFHKYWLNESNSWLIPEWSKAGKSMVESCKNGVKNELELRVLQQAGRELLLSQSSDWSFILKAGTTTELAKERIHRHLKRFWLLINSLDNEQELPQSKLIELEKEDCIFPLIHANDWKKYQNDLRIKQ